jgi:hypothetical protein
MRAVGKMHRWVAAGALIAAGYVAGSSVAPPSSAVAEVREVRPPATFKSGGERSEAVLKEIAAMLQRMDTRLANLEKAANELVVLGKK